MTTSSVSQLNLYTADVSTVSSKKAQPVDDFSQMLKNQTTDRESTVKTVEEKKVENPELKAAEKTKEVDTKETVEKDKTVSEEVKENKKTVVEKEVEETDELTDEEVEAALNAISSMVNEIAKVLHVSKEDVQAALNELGLNPEDVLNLDALPKLVVALTEGADDLSLMTDETVFQSAESLKNSAKDLLQQLSETLDIPMEDMETYLSKATEVEVIEMPNAKFTFAGTEENGQLANRAVADPQVIVEASESSKGKEEQSDTNPNTNSQSFAQTVFDQIKTAVAKTESTTVSYTSTTESIMNQVENIIKVIQKDNLTEMELQLHPASLGHVKVQLSTQEGLVTANFTAENEAVKAALESQIVVLKQNFEEQGLKVEAVEVTVASHAFEENLSNSEQGSNGETEQKKTHRRKLSLNEIMSADMMDELPEEERVVADMMMRNGNTVDYQA